MNFAFTRRNVSGRRAEQARFRVERLTRGQTGTEVDVSHLIDRTYAYHSARELHWHLADRFGLDVQEMTLQSR
ncbi:MAG TPA: hypothetical protein VHL98_08240 [Microvirga sp.]|jgi:hypothetical protein|nr:hypothetical protein [Microvirga sp.]